ncbi:MAG: alpha/beta fold hydrolase [Propionibacteriales bacterium]|nr:alpha/beta fold hydrolase [Propionibacteriales bacterium]
MATFSAPDGTELAYHVVGEGAPVVCLPGGPMQSSVYLGDLGGLSAHRRLILLDLRGTGESGEPENPASYRCDHLVDDIDALREHLGLDRMDLLAHSAGTNLAVLYAARHPSRIGKLMLITPSTRAVDITVTGQARREAAQLRNGEPWFPAAYAALEATTAGEGTDEDWDAIAPFLHGRWDAAAQAVQAMRSEQTNAVAAEVFGAEGAFDPDATRGALTTFGAPVLLLAGELDLNTLPSAAAEFADLFPSTKLVIQPGSGHYPWLDDADRFVATTRAFLG